jgi:hypothetical protein
MTPALKKNAAGRGEQCNQHGVSKATQPHLKSGKSASELRRAPYACDAHLGKDSGRAIASPRPAARLPKWQ